ncbi:MAG: alpha/beta fold hydrolase, partial [Bacteroidota bacterium]
MKEVESGASINIITINFNSYKIQSTNMTSKTIHSLILGIAMLVVYYCSAQQKEEFTPTFTVSKNTTHQIPEDRNYTFGYLEVLENRNNPQSNIIKLPVYIFKSRSQNPKPDPIIYTVGGPGYSTMSSAQYTKYYKYLDDRDFIFFEQRGNYYAQPHLDCPEWSKAIHLSGLPNFESNKSDSLFTHAAKVCRQRLVERGIDLNGYHTKETAADIEDLRTVLGIDQYNLLTISYSTKIAQVLLRDYSESIRSVVMDSPLPLKASYDEESVGNLLESIELLLNDCESDSGCRTAFPDLKERFFSFLRDITETPLKIDVENPKIGVTETFQLKGKDVIGLFSSVSTNDVANVPMEINKVLNGDFGAIEDMLKYRFQEPGNGSGIGMRLSVWCAEEYPFNNQSVIQEESEKYPELKGLSPAVYKASVCKIWNVVKAPDIENEAVASTIPVLIISGEYDNDTPVKWAKHMRPNLPNSHHLVFKGWKHIPTTNWSNPCA